MTEPLLPYPDNPGRLDRCSMCQADLPPDEPTMMALRHLEGFGRLVAKICTSCSNSLASPPPIADVDTDPDDDPAAQEWTATQDPMWGLDDFTIYPEDI